MPPATKNQSDDAPPDAFTFAGPDGTEHTLRPTLDELTPALVRRHRDMEQASFNMMLFELLADDAAIDAWDSTTWAQNRALMADFEAHTVRTLRVAVGESEGSSSSSTGTRKPSNVS